MEEEVHSRDKNKYRNQSRCYTLGRMWGRKGASWSEEAFGGFSRHSHRRLHLIAAIYKKTPALFLCVFFQEMRTDLQQNKKAT